MELGTPARGPSVVRRLLAHRVWLLAGLLLLVHASLIVLSARSVSVVGDEFNYFHVGRVILRHGFAHEYTRNQGPLPLYANQLFVPDFPSGGLDTVAPDAELLFRGRLGTLPFALLMAALVFLWARKLFGDAGGLLALLVHALDPLLLGYGGSLLVDAQHAAMTLLALYVSWRYLETRSPKLLPWIGVTLGMALATKYLAVLLVLPVGLTVAIVAALPAPGAGRRASVTRGVGALVLVAASALLTLHAAYLFREGLGSARPEDFASSLLKDLAGTPVLGWLVGLLPPPFLRGVDFQLTQSERDWQPFLNGVFQHGHPDYYLWTILCKTPEVVLLCALLVLALRLPRLLGRDAPAGWRTTAAATLPYALLLFGYMSLSPMQLGPRYVLPLFPLLFLALGALAWKRGERTLAPRTLAAGALLAVLLGAELVRNWPDWIYYSNRASGGQALAFRRFRDTMNDLGVFEFARLRSLRADHGDFQTLRRGSGARFGRLALDVEALASPTASCRWLTWLDPVAHEGASWWIFELTPEAFEAHVAASADTLLRRDLAVAYLGAGRRPEAERHIAELGPELAGPLQRLITAEDAARERPARPELERLLRAWLDLDRVDRAEAVVHAHPAEFAGSLQAALACVMALEERRDYAGAVELIEGSSLKDNLLLRYALVRNLRRVGQKTRAAAEFEALALTLAGRPKGPEYLEFAADIQVQMSFQELLR